MFEEISKKHFPMELPADVTGHLVDKAAWDHAGETVGDQIFLSPEDMGHFRAPKSRLNRLERLRQMYVVPNPSWVIFYDVEDAPVGYFYGYMEDDMTLFIDTIGLIPAYRGRGIYTAFLKRLIAYLDEMGYERLTTSHHPNNRAVMIPELKVGFNIVGLELHECCGPLLKMAYLFHEDRRRGFREVLSLHPESI